jgi:hypothetical protein
VLAGAPAGSPRLDAAHCEQAPFMYEMKGALFTCCLYVVHAVSPRCPHGVHRIRAVIHGFIHSLSTVSAARRAEAPGRPEREPPPDLPYPPGNKPENTIAPFQVKTYHGFMTTWQALKRAGYMHPDSSLEAALFSNRRGVVAV